MRARCSARGAFRSPRVRFREPRAARSRDDCDRLPSPKPGRAPRTSRVRRPLPGLQCGELRERQPMGSTAPLRTPRPPAEGPGAAAQIGD
jgi:hypothetical protein